MASQQFLGGELFLLGFGREEQTSWDWEHGVQCFLNRNHGYCSGDFEVCAKTQIEHKGEDFFFLSIVEDLRMEILRDPTKEPLRLDLHRK